MVDLFGSIARAYRPVVRACRLAVSLLVQWVCLGQLSRLPACFQRVVLQCYLYSGFARRCLCSSLTCRCLCVAAVFSSVSCFAVYSVFSLLLTAFCQCRLGAAAVCFLFPLLNCVASLLIARARVVVHFIIFVFACASGLAEYSVLFLSRRSFPVVLFLAG